MRAPVRAATATTLVAIAGIHVAWGRGSSFPFGSHGDLTDAVVGSNVTPSPPACFAVAALLTVLTARGAAGLAGRTDALVPGSTSPRFRRNDRRYFAPLCLALAAGSATALGS